MCPEHERGDRLDRLQRPLGRSLVLAMGLGVWDLEKRAQEDTRMVAYLVRYSNGSLSWEAAQELPVSTIHRRIWALSHWIKAENSPSK